MKLLSVSHNGATGDRLMEKLTSDVFVSPSEAEATAAARDDALCYV